VPALERLASTIFRDTEPDAIYSKENPMRIETSEEGTVINLKVPLAEKLPYGTGELNLYRTRDNIVVDVGQHRRMIALPVGLYDTEVSSAELKNGVLTIKFGGGKVGGRKGRRKRSG
ncbi:MAG: hypothetical protein QXP70_05625, partial [Methanomassiliicoccales archaeon]